MSREFQIGDVVCTRSALQSCLDGLAALAELGRVPTTSIQPAYSTVTEKVANTCHGGTQKLLAVRPPSEDNLCLPELLYVHADEARAQLIAAAQAAYKRSAAVANERYAGLKWETTQDTPTPAAPEQT